MDDNRHSDLELAALERKLSTVSTEADKFAAVDTFTSLCTNPSNLASHFQSLDDPIPQEDKTRQGSRLQDVLEKGGIAEAYSKRTLLREDEEAALEAALPLKRLPCAMVSASCVPCEKVGASMCAACGLVAYCSKVCLDSLPPERLGRPIEDLLHLGLPNDPLEAAQEGQVAEDRSSEARELAGSSQITKAPSAMSTGSRSGSRRSEFLPSWGMGPAGRVRRSSGSEWDCEVALSLSSTRC